MIQTTTFAGIAQTPVLGAVVFGSPIEIIDGNNFNRYNCVKAIKTFKHKDYCCPFCSHGETIQLKVYDEYRGRLQGTYRKAYLECSEGCMSYGVFESTFCRGYTEKETISSIIQEALCLGNDAPPSSDDLVEILKPELQNAFKPAFLGRLKVVTYYPIRDEIMRRIIELKLGKIKRRIMENHRAELIYDDALVGAVASRCTEVDSGARNVDNILNGTLLPEIAEAVLARMAQGQEIAEVKVTVSDTGSFQFDIK